jgi:hypothetical protein
MRVQASAATVSPHVAEVLFFAGPSRCFYAKKIGRMTFCRSALRGGGIDVVEW